MMKIGDSMKKSKLKKVPKRLLILLICILIIICIIIFLPKNNNKSKNNNHVLTTEEKNIQELKKIPYYKEELKERYQAYQKEHKELSTEDIITQVNIGIDQPYYINTKPSENLNTNLILVNKYNYLTEDYIPNNLEAIDASYARSGMQLVSEAKDAFETLSKAAKEDGMNIIAMSSYRSYDYQVTLYNLFRTSNRTSNRRLQSRPTIHIL